MDRDTARKGGRHGEGRHGIQYADEGRQPNVRLGVVQTSKRDNLEHRLHAYRTTALMALFVDSAADAPPMTPAVYCAVQQLGN